MPSLTEKEKNGTISREAFTLADVVKLADTLDLGSSTKVCRFKSCHPHQVRKTLHVALSCIMESRFFLR